jgi:tRNA(Arg) A34 adenosine deaminase TadA
VADERCPYAHGPLVALEPTADGKQWADKQGRIYTSILTCPQCKGCFSVAGVREIVEVRAL